MVVIQLGICRNNNFTIILHMPPYSVLLPLFVMRRYTHINLTAVFIDALSFNLNIGLSVNLTFV